MKIILFQLVLLLTIRAQAMPVADEYLADSYLIDAASKCSEAGVTIALERGANIKATTYNIAGERGVLISAVEAQCPVQFIFKLIELGADRDETLKLTPKKESLFSYLLNHISLTNEEISYAYEVLKIPVNMPLGSDGNLLHWLVFRGRFDFIEKALTWGLDPNELDGLGNTYISMKLNISSRETILTAKSNPLAQKIFRDYLKYGGRLDTRVCFDERPKECDIWGFYTWEYILKLDTTNAIKMRKVFFTDDVVKVLPMTSLGSGGSNIIHYLVHFPIVLAKKYIKIAVKNGADINQRNQITPLEYARKYAQDSDLASFLVELGAKE